MSKSIQAKLLVANVQTSPDSYDKEVQMNIQRYSPEQVEEMDAGNVSLGSYSLRYTVSRALCRAPCDSVDRVTKGCLIKPCYRRGGHYISKDVLTGKSLIILPEAILNREEDEFNFILLHEVAHFVLGHDSSPSDTENDRQEDEADALARQWLVESEAEQMGHFNSFGSLPANLSSCDDQGF